MKYERESNPVTKSVYRQIIASSLSSIEANKVRL